MHSKWRLAIAFILTVAFAVAGAQPPKAGGNAVKFVHDPVIMKAGGYYYVYCTGAGIPMRRSKDLVTWEYIGRVFERNAPQWAIERVPGANNIWAPDISFYEGKYHLYYAVSTFGSMRSVIGYATNATLDPSDKRYRWVDEGFVIGSEPKDGYNAIDPNIVLCGKGRVEMAFGSFWSGLKMVEISPKTGKPKDGAPVRSIARRPDPDALEGPFIVRRGRYYYLFAAFDLGCRGVDSTYNIRVGRSEKVDGPYVDRAGTPMMEGGGTLLLGTVGREIGPGHCAVLQEGAVYRLVYHFYDRDDRGIPTLRVRSLLWDAAGWPAVGAD